MRKFQPTLTQLDELEKAIQELPTSTPNYYLEVRRFPDEYHWGWSFEELKTVVIILGDAANIEEIILWEDGPQPDTINWKHIPPEYNFCIRAKRGDVIFLREKPDLDLFPLRLEPGDRPGEVKFSPEQQKFLSHYKKGNLPWRESLLERPNEV